MTDENPMPEIDSAATEVFAQIVEGAASILESTVGYKARCVAAGISEPVAEQMALHFHEGLMRVWWGNQT